MVRACDEWTGFRSSKTIQVTEGRLRPHKATAEYSAVEGTSELPFR